MPTFPYPSSHLPSHHQPTLLHTLLLTLSYPSSYLLLFNLPTYIPSLPCHANLFTFLLTNLPSYSYYLTRTLSCTSSYLSTILLLLLAQCIPYHTLPHLPTFLYSFLDAYLVIHIFSPSYLPAFLPILLLTNT